MRIKWSDKANKTLETIVKVETKENFPHIYPVTLDRYADVFFTVNWDSIASKLNAQLPETINAKQAKNQ